MPLTIGVPRETFAGEKRVATTPDVARQLQDLGFEIAVETNGTRPAPAGLDWVCVSPKAGTDLALAAGDELKLIYPQPGAEPPLARGRVPPVPVGCSPPRCDELLHTQGRPRRSTRASVETP